MCHISQHSFKQLRHGVSNLRKNEIRSQHHRSCATPFDQKKSNFRQCGQMKKQRWEASEKRREEKGREGKGREERRGEEKDERRKTKEERGRKKKEERRKKKEERRKKKEERRKQKAERRKKKEERRKKKEERRSEKRKRQKKEERRKKKEDAGVREEKSVATTVFFHCFVAPGGRKTRFAKAAGAEPSGEMRDEKLHAVVVVQSRLRSHQVERTGTLLGVVMLKSARRCGPKHMSKCKV